jgi:cytochrome c oxidase subunit I
MTGSACAVSPKVLGWTAFAVMVAGPVIIAVPLLGNQATVLFTLYPLMKARGIYLGLILVVAVTWPVALNLCCLDNAWRAEHPDDWTPRALSWCSSPVC